ncbi:uncharacterized protein CMU_026320 [Cryptosporidium muris RN66]|uniref:BACK domain-containing protein n=1 Tax=Cryptosporidium muris (strain RN66) TaxID=441375 RepID=B6AB73_CRYMR|nr:uncharacterized protein CMU_026320 [Cryptosporidium muris RN66]EEA05625.1 hypothetical protein, conserved [Cryptosporidium muris RN66]|eukprot:XP_002139974.1 hypothetical protein [Cryptosporidium muris RN66]
MLEDLGMTCNNLFVSLYNYELLNLFSFTSNNDLNDIVDLKNSRGIKLLVDINELCKVFIKLHFQSLIKFLKYNLYSWSPQEISDWISIFRADDLNVLSEDLLFDVILNILKRKVFITEENKRDLLGCIRMNYLSKSNQIVYAEKEFATKELLHILKRKIIGYRYSPRICYCNLISYSQVKWKNLDVDLPFIVNELSQNEKRVAEIPIEQGTCLTINIHFGTLENKNKINDYCEINNKLLICCGVASTLRKKNINFLDFKRQYFYNGFLKDFYSIHINNNSELKIIDLLDKIGQESMLNNKNILTGDFTKSKFENNSIINIPLNNWSAIFPEKSNFLESLTLYEILTRDQGIIHMTVNRINNYLLFQTKSGLSVYISCPEFQNIDEPLYPFIVFSSGNIHDINSNKLKDNTIKTNLMGKPHDKVSAVLYGSKTCYKFSLEVQRRNAGAPKRVTRLRYNRHFQKQNIDNIQIQANSQYKSRVANSKNTSSIYRGKYSDKDRFIRNRDTRMRYKRLIEGPNEYHIIEDTEAHENQNKKRKTGTFIFSASNFLFNAITNFVSFKFLNLGTKYWRNLGVDSIVKSSEEKQKN